MNIMEEKEKEKVKEKVESKPIPTVKPKQKRKKRNYLNNADLLEETLKSQADGKMTDKLAKMLMILCDRYRASRTGNFTRYTYFDEMKSCALENLVKTGWQSFNGEKYSNAFAFYTQCVHNSYIKYLKYEKKHRDTRDALLVNAGLEASFTYMEKHSSNNSSDYGSDNIADNSDKDDLIS